MIEVRERAEAQRIYAEAREHHRLSQQHRRAARIRMQDLRALCDRYGIPIEVITRKDGDRSHGPQGRGQH